MGGTDPIDIRPTGHMKILNNVARLYELVAEMREVINELHQVNVEVRIARYGRDGDPLVSQATVSVMLRPGCELIEK